METAAVFCGLVGLMGFAWMRGGDRSILLILALNFAATAAVDRLMKTQPDTDTSVIMADLATIYALRFICPNPRSCAIGLIGLFVIMLTTARMGTGIMGNYAMAVTANIAFAAQVLVGGGFADDLGRWFDRWVFRLWPRFAGALRLVAGS